MYIRVYTKDRCPACRMTKRWLDDHDVQYVQIKLADANGNPVDEEAKAKIDSFRDLGCQQFPVVDFISGCFGGFISGFNPQKLNEVKKWWDATPNHTTTLEGIKAHPEGGPVGPQGESGKVPDCHKK